MSLNCQRGEKSIPCRPCNFQCPKIVYIVQFKALFTPFRRYMYIPKMIPQIFKPFIL